MSVHYLLTSRSHKYVCNFTAYFCAWTTMQILFRQPDTRCRLIELHDLHRRHRSYNTEKPLRQPAIQFWAHSPTMSKSQVGRRRGSDSAEPGSARAVYLEKNRKAASKCRSKQKRQQEELIETARDVERRNKIGSSSEEWDAGSDASRWPAHKVF